VDLLESDDRFWFLRKIDEVFLELNTTKNGLSSTEAAKRLAEEGLNVLAEEDKNRLFKIILRNLNNILIYILLMSGILSIISGHMIEFYVIFAIIIMTVFLGVIQEFRAGKAIDALKQMTSKKVDVLRGGMMMTIIAEDLVRGDIISLNRGMIAPADIRVIEANSLMADESVLTGESVQKSKHSNKLVGQDILLSDRNNMIFSGTSITNGKGIGVVVETGIKSEIGKISGELKEIGDQKSPLQNKIDKMSKRISYVVIITCIILFMILMFRGNDIFGALLLISAVAVSGIPESFPLALTLALSSGVKKMAKQNAIVRDLASVETLGTTTVICTDKTGTLTQNKMIVEKVYFADGFEMSVLGEGYCPNSSFHSGGKKVDQNKLSFYDNFFKACVLCNNSELLLEAGACTLKGEPTEGAILVLAKSAGFDDVELREDYKLLKEFPFDPSKKFMITVNSAGKNSIAYLKGSAENVLEKSSFIRTGKNAVRKITSKDIQKFHAVVHKYGSEGYRVIGIATKNIVKSTALKDKEINSSCGYVFEGFVAILDPVRPDAFSSIEECMSAGIRVMMITGDHKKTAESIGKKLGILTTRYDKIIEGSELENMSDEDLDNVIENVAIFARTTPDHKLRIVSSLQRKGEIVAMTGDGVNDAPALKKADIGVSMGKGGTDVARESSNMILVDDNFSTIVNAIREGRTIYSNIRRFAYYLLTGNMTEVGLIALAIIFGLVTPLTALMVLFINIVTSTFPAIALSIEPTHHKVMNQKPRNPDEKILSKYIILKILVLVPILFMGTMLLFQMEYQATGSIEKARTMAFATIVLFELFHVFNARSLHVSIFNTKFFSNKYIFYAVGSSLMMVILAIHTGLGQSIFGTIPLTSADWLIITLVSSSVVVISEVIKMLIRSEFEEQMSLKGLNHKFE
jgi:Ca2+-transporting ATPase